jgi:flagellum-specific peptidoglycan hydrolase FlgJ
MKKLHLLLFILVSVVLVRLTNDSSKASAAHMRLNLEKEKSTPTMMKEDFDLLYNVGRGMIGPFNYVIVSPDTLGMIRHNDTVLIWEENGHFELSDNYYRVDSMNNYDIIPNVVLTSNELNEPPKPEKEEEYLTEPANPVAGRNYNELAKGKKWSKHKEEKVKKQLAYVKRYHTVAQKEMEKYGIPASIKLAQGLLESNAGESRLAVNNNNHFGIKCFARHCKPGHCSNYTDDSHKDFFRKYNNVWESYRAHSYLLVGNGKGGSGRKPNGRYKSLFKLKKTDYRGWAYGLKKAGYATDPRYPGKLIGIIEDLRLYQYDK